MFGRASRTEYRRGVKGKPKHPGWEFFSTAQASPAAVCDATVVTVFEWTAPRKGKGASASQRPAASARSSASATWIAARFVASRI